MRNFGRRSPQYVFGFGVALSYPGSASLTPRLAQRTRNHSTLSREERFGKGVIKGVERLITLRGNCIFYKVGPRCECKPRIINMIGAFARLRAIHPMR